MPRSPLARLRAVGSSAGARYGGLLRQRDARLLLGSAFVSEIGDWFNIVALIALAYRFGDGALGVGVMLAVRMAPRLLFQIPAGALVDRFAGPRFLAAVQLAMAAVAGSFAFLTVMPEVWLLYGLVFALEAVNTVAWPAFRVQVARTVPVDRRGAANGLLALGLNVGQLIGPLIGSAVLAATSPAVVFFANGLTFLGNAVAVAMVGRRASVAAGARRAAGAGDEAGAASAAVGYAWLVRRPQLGAYAGLQLAVTLMIQGTIALFVTRARDLGLGDYGTGVFYSSVAVGSVVGSAVAGVGLHRERAALYLVAASLGTAAIALAVFGFVGALPLAIAALVAAGAGTDVGEVVALTHFQHRLPEALYGRFLSIFLIALSAGGVAGALLGPVLARVIGVDGTLSLLAVPVLGLGAVLAAMVPRGGLGNEPAIEAGRWHRSSF